MKIAVIGIGQSLRGDDGVGLAAVRLWQEMYPDSADQVQVELAENPGIGLLNLIDEADTAILVDAVQSSASPGTIHQLIEDDLSAFLDGADSAHGWGVAETLALGRQIISESMPNRISLVGIEIETIELGDQLSPKIEAVLPEVARIIEEIIKASKVSETLSS